MTDDQKLRNVEALSRGVDEALARELGCSPTEDVLGLYVDRELYRAGILPPEVLDGYTPEQRAIVTAEAAR